MDKLATCDRCGSNVCYEQRVNDEITTWMCMSCGFSTSTTMVQGSPLAKATLETSPELYKDLMYVDNSQRIWFPVTIAVPERGMVFVDGSSKEDWRWASVLAIEVTKEYRKEKKYPKDQKYRMDMEKVKYFPQSDFMLAMEAAGFFN